MLVLLFSSLWWRPSATADRIWNINNLDGLRLHISQALNCARCSAAPAKCSTDAANGFWLSCCHDSTSTCMSDTVERTFSRPGGFSFFLEKQGSCDVELRETKRHPQNYKSTLLAAAAAAAIWRSSEAQCSWHFICHLYTTVPVFWFSVPCSTNRQPEFISLLDTFANTDFFFFS